MSREYEEGVIFSDCECPAFVDETRYEHATRCRIFAEKNPDAVAAVEPAPCPHAWQPVESIMTLLNDQETRAVVVRVGCFACGASKPFEWTA